jgi:hypothetical protein
MFDFAFVTKKSTVYPRFNGPHSADLGFNGPNFGAGRFRKYQTSLVNTCQL